jgi:hypothetical protein
LQQADTSPAFFLRDAPAAFVQMLIYSIKENTAADIIDDPSEYFFG